MKVMAEQFVMGRSVDAALARSRQGANTHYRYSFNMLGEAAITAVDAKSYFAAYASAIASIGNSVSERSDTVFAQPSISVKLSALHPRYEYAQRERVLSELVPAIVDLARAAQRGGI